MTASTTSEPQTRSTLDRRRNTLQTRRAAAEATAAKVAALDEELNLNAVHTQEFEASLQAALDRVAGLKKGIKAAKKTRARLRAERKDARGADARSRQRADAAESKYDRAVLADMLRREKDRDLSVHAGSTPAAAPKAAAAATPPASSSPQAAPGTPAEAATAPAPPAGGGGQATPARTGATRAAARPNGRSTTAGGQASGRARSPRAGGPA